MTVYKVKLKGREDVAEGTMAFHFEMPSGFSFEPGQAIDIVLIDPPATDAQSARHTFSVVSAPFQKELVIATRMRASAFKRALEALPTGGAVKVEGPFGDLTLGDAKRPAVFIAGGIGITPFMSMLRQATRDARPQRLSLIYSNRRPEDAAFLAELQDLERQNKNVRLLATMTEMSKSASRWDGEQRVVDADLVKRCVGDMQSPIYYLAGPPAMVDAMQEMLRDAGIAAGDIRSEEFYGY